MPVATNQMGLRSLHFVLTSGEHSKNSRLAFKALNFVTFAKPSKKEALEI